MRIMHLYLLYPSANACDLKVCNCVHVEWDCKHSIARPNLCDELLLNGCSQGETLSQAAKQVQVRPAKAHARAKPSLGYALMIHPELCVMFHVCCTSFSSWLASR